MVCLALALPPDFTLSFHSHKPKTTQLIDDFGMTREMYGALSGLPAIPNIVFGPLGGVIVDWIGAGAYHAGVEEGLGPHLTIQSN